ncbi:MAG: VCBS repeat-containing protein [Deltaproteobacteria bacterium]|nr:VCBS repeat-containing protein [Deltaproteobacteria bacterium]MBW2259043.1 VCBS repeat-containing protein [Deltaproteobacteria bacterium]
MNARLRNRLFPFILLLSLVAMTAGQGMAEEPSRVVILPYEINADRDLSFISEGIVDMLSSRLAWEDKVVIVPEEETKQAIKDVSLPPTEEIARNLGTELQASHVLFGSATVFGKSVSLDSKVVDVLQMKPTLTFSNRAEGMDDLIPQVDLLADEINEKVFDRRPEGVQQPVQAPERPGIYAHPETLLGAGAVGAAAGAAGQQKAPTGAAPTGAAAAGGFVAVGSVAPTDMTVEGFWKSQPYKTAVNGMALGDVDGDNRIEVVFVSKDHIYVHRFEDERFLKIWEKGGKRYQSYIAVDVADVNGNGRAEIFVTNVEGSGQRLASFVLEWDGSDFKQVSNNDPWYYRVIDVPGRGQVLYGQKRKVDELFASGVYELAWGNGEYEPGERLKLPKRVNIFGFALGDAMNNGQPSIIAYDETDKIRIYDVSADEQWRSDKRYGGSMNYLEYKMHMDGAQGDVGHYFLPQRIFVRDLNNDGINEVIVSHNKGSVGELFSRLRHFSNGHVTSLFWNRYELYPNLQTPGVKGYISDFCIGDYDHDGRDEVVVAQVRKQGTLLTSSKSVIIGYELPQPAPVQ